MSFKFIDNGIDLDIEGHSFHIEIGDVETVERLLALKDITPEQAPSDPGGLKAVCAALGKQFDAILGEGAYAKIFAGRRPNLNDHILLSVYLFKELNNARMEGKEGAFLGGHRGPEVAASTEEK